jgi:hypothetical protein
MHKSAKEILSGFISGDACSEDELKALGKWLEDSAKQPEIDALLHNEWGRKPSQWKHNLIFRKFYAVSEKTIQKKTK